MKRISKKLVKKTSEGWEHMLVEHYQAQLDVTKVHALMALLASTDSRVAVTMIVSRSFLEPTRLSVTTPSGSLTLKGWEAEMFLSVTRLMSLSQRLRSMQGPTSRRENSTSRKTPLLVT